MVELTDSEKEYLKKLYERRKSILKERMKLTFLDLMNLYKIVKDYAEDYNLDIKKIDFESIIDFSLSYEENKTLLEEHLMRNLSYYSKELAEIEYYQQRIKELEEELRKSKDTEYLRKLENELQKLRKKVRTLEKEREIKEVKAEKEDIRKAVREELKEYEKATSEVFKKIIDLIRTTREEIKKAKAPEITLPPVFEIPEYVPENVVKEGERGIYLHPFVVKKICPVCGREFKNLDDVTLSKIEPFFSEILFYHPQYLDACPLCVREGMKLAPYYTQIDVINEKASLIYSSSINFKSNYDRNFRKEVAEAFKLLIQTKKEQGERL